MIGQTRGTVAIGGSSTSGAPSLTARRTFAPAPVRSNVITAPVQGGPRSLAPSGSADYFGEHAPAPIAFGGGDGGGMPLDLGPLSTQTAPGNLGPSSPQFAQPANFAPILILGAAAIAAWLILR